MTFAVAEDRFEPRPGRVRVFGVGQMHCPLSSLSSFISFFAELGLNEYDIDKHHLTCIEFTAELCPKILGIICQM